jgi:hypothetical protein
MELGIVTVALTKKGPVYSDRWLSKVIRDLASDLVPHHVRRQALA